jgi:ABC-type oligopeptide transport system substrate-binding subunit
MRRLIKVLAVAALLAAILTASVSPASALKARGGVLMPTRVPCFATANAQNHAGAHLINDPPDRTQEGCWAELPPGANHDD